MAATAQGLVSPKLQNILFTTDFSPCSETALPYARSIAELFGSTVHVVHVVALEPPIVGEFGFLIPQTDPQREAEVEKLAHGKMDQLTHSDAFKRLHHTQVIEKGIVSDVVMRLVEALHGDLIVLATHGRHGLKHLMLGSVAEEVFRRAGCPVLTVGPGIHKDGFTSGNLKTILLATDFSPATGRAVEYAVLLARRVKATVSLLHVMNESEASVLAFDEAGTGVIRQRLSGLMPDDGSISYNVSVETGTAADMIVEKAAEIDAGLIVMGAHRGRAASAHAPWAVAHRVVCEAPCAVLSVRG